MSNTGNNIQGVKPHKDYFLTGGDLHFIVEESEFCVHRYFFQRESPRFNALLAPTSPGKVPQGGSKLTAIKLQDVVVKDFERFLWVFYNPTYSLYDATVSDWSCILRLAYDWQFAEVVKLAVRELEKMPMSVVERIVLYQKHHISEDLLVPHYASLCARGYPLDLDESEQLGMTTVVLLNQALHCLCKRQTSEESTSPVNATNATTISKINAHVESRKAGTPNGTEPLGGLVTVSPFFPPWNFSEHISRIFSRQECGRPYNH
ncbi:hypothetical protein B0H10DRAFT_2323889 [Mycena sp. CBHHK59/15]|nr:hypothetical protein B0H10DRAFT_2323889 [Mycena sp. CBHHK59/15]